MIVHAKDSLNLKSLRLIMIFWLLNMSISGILWIRRLDILHQKKKKKNQSQDPDPDLESIQENQKSFLGFYKLINFLYSFILNRDKKSKKNRNKTKSKKSKKKKEESSSDSESQSSESTKFFF